MDKVTITKPNLKSFPEVFPASTIAFIKYGVFNKLVVCVTVKLLSVVYVKLPSV